MTGGVGKALGEVMEALPDGEEAVQAALFDAPEDVGALDAPSPLSALLQPRRRGRGRPPGSKNRRTEEVARWLLSQARHPVLVMMEAYSMTPDQLGKAIGIVEMTDDLRVELLKLQLRMAEAAAPYVAQKRPQAVEVSADGAVQVTLAMGGPDGVSLPARGGLAGRGDLVIEGEVMGVRLPKSDAASRTDD